MINWKETLPEELLDAAYAYRGEIAWRRQDALRVSKILSDKHYVVLGVDIWIPDQDGPRIPTPFVYDWSLETHRSPSGPRTAAEFISSFQWDETDESARGHEPYFVITADRRSN